MKILKRYIRQESEKVFNTEMFPNVLEFQEVIDEINDLKHELEFELGAISDLRQNLEEILSVNDKYSE